MPYVHPMLETLPERPAFSDNTTDRPNHPLTPPSSGSVSPALKPRLIDYDGLCAPSLGTRARTTESPAAAAERKSKMEEAARILLECVGEDPLRGGLRGTPERLARAMLDATNGYQLNLHDVIGDALYEEDSNDMVLIKDICISSTCEHHLLPFSGSLHIGYIPNGRVLGLSKFARIAEMFAQRLQIQERLTKQIAGALQEVLQPQGLAVVMEMTHSCMTCRGVRQGSSGTTTSSMQGMMRSRDRTRREFLSLLGKG
ncbi:MAG: hypothetical protein Q9162_003739 [Coniocarpon cinnabarinum]